MKKRLFNRQEALEVCRAYYQARGYSEEHCHGYIDHLKDWELERIYMIICEELEISGSNETNLLTECMIKKF